MLTATHGREAKKQQYRPAAHSGCDCEFCAHQTDRGQASSSVDSAAFSAVKGSKLAHLEDTIIGHEAHSTDMLPNSHLLTTQLLSALHNTAVNPLPVQCPLSGVHQCCALPSLAADSRLTRLRSRATPVSTSTNRAALCEQRYSHSQVLSCLPLFSCAILDYM